MAIEKSEALILRVVPFRDTSKVVTAYSAERGLVSLLAKGVRGPKPRYGAALDLFSVADLVYYHKDSRELQLLAQASLLEPHLRLSEDPERYIFGVAVLEFLLRVLAGEEAPGRLYHLSLRVLEVLETCGAAALGPVFRAFEIKAASFLGHRPELYACVECGREGRELGRAGFAPLLGGIVCGDCTGQVAGVMAMSPEALGVLRGWLTSTLADVAGAEVEPAAARGAAQLLEPFLVAQIERYEGLRAMRMAPAVVRRAAGANGGNG